MQCDDIRSMLSSEGPDLQWPQAASLRRHIETCSSCQHHWLALRQVDKALHAQPLLATPTELQPHIMQAIQSRPQTEITAPFSRAFCITVALATILALVAGAWQLNAWSAPPASPAGSLAREWLHPAWPASISAWLTVQGDQLAQVVLPIMVGLIITLGGVAIGFRASDHNHADDAQSTGKGALSTRP